MNEEVYLLVSENPQQVSGPYLVSAVLPNKKYRLRKQDTGVELDDKVDEDRLLNKVS